MRRAFAQAIDRDAFNAIYGGTAKPGATLLPPGLPGYAKANEAILQYDPNAARKALVDAGYPDGRGFPPGVTILLIDDVLDHNAFSFLQQWKTTLNVSVQAEWVDASTWYARTSAKRFALTLGSWIGDYPNADDWLPTLYGSAGTQNFYNYSNPQYDAAVAAAYAETDPIKQAGLWADAEQILLQDAAVAPLKHDQIIGLWRPNLHGQTAGFLDSSFLGDEYIETAYVAN